MHVRADTLDEEVRGTVDTAVEIANLIADQADRATMPPEELLDLPEALRSILVTHDFVRARAATRADLAELVDRCAPIARLVLDLPAVELEDAVTALNAQLAACAIAPSLSAHDGFPLHVHWTSASAPFAHQVAVDLLMALAQTLCDHGTERFGVCAAEGCEQVFFDATKNRSRRFCADPRCASRTHTAAHRARHRDD